MKKIAIFSLVFILLLSGCAKAPEPPETYTPPQPTADPITPQVAEFLSKEHTFDYDGKKYKTFYSGYGYDYYFDGVRLIPTDDTVEVREILYDLPNDVDNPLDCPPETFDGIVFIPENDAYKNDIVFVYNKYLNVYYPFYHKKDIKYHSGETVKSYVDKTFGEGSFQNIAEVRIAYPNVYNEWYELPSDIKGSLLKEIKAKSLMGAKCDCDNHLSLRLVMQKTRFEQTLTLCPKSQTVNGRKISDTLCDDIMSCIHTDYYREIKE